MRNPSFASIIQAIQSGHKHLPRIAEACRVTTGQARHQLHTLVEKGVIAYERDEDAVPNGKKPNKYWIIGKLEDQGRPFDIPPRDELMTAFFGPR